MRLGLLTGEYPPQHGGVGDYTHALAAALAAQGADVHIITHQRARGLAPVTVHPVIGRWGWGALLQVRALARRLKLDLLHIQYQAAAYGLSVPIHLLPDVAGLPTFVTFHDLREPYLFPKAGARLRRWAVNHLAARAVGVITTDRPDQRELASRGVARALTSIPIGSNIAPAPPAGYDRGQWRLALGVQPAELLLGYFGFLNQSKGGDTLISALALLADRRAAAKLLLIGGAAGASDPTDAAFAAQLERQIKRHGLEDRILRTGFVAPDQVSAALLACDAVVLPYRDGVSFRRGSLLAALAHGCPIITTTPAQPMPELHDGENVRLVPPESAPALVLAVTSLLDAPALRAQLSRGAQALAARFDWAAIAAETLNFYRASAGRASHHARG
ncbi:MAG: glycosyltransferase [Anaerolineales bacterium]|nr:glycosyltransferase [Anaerolineales bacterium]